MKLFKVQRYATSKTNESKMKFNLNVLRVWNTH